MTILLVTEDSFGKLMMLLVIKDSRVLEKKFLTGENIPYQSCSTIDIFFFNLLLTTCLIDFIVNFFENAVSVTFFK